MSAYQVQADPTAVMGRRIMAFIVDVILVLVVFTAYVGLFVDNETIDFNPCADPVENGAQVCSDLGVTAVWTGDEAMLYDSDGVNIAYAIAGGYTILIFWLLQGATGATPGKALFGLRAVNEQGQAAGIGRAIVRSLLMIIDFTCCWLIGLIAAMSSKGHRRIGDMAAKTFVIGSRDTGRPVIVPGLTPPAAAAPMATGPYAQAQPGAWSTAPPVMAPTMPAATPPTASEAQWDEARQAYIQWDPAQNAWLQFDQGTQTWNRI